MDFTLLNYQLSDLHIASVHRTGCRDIQRDARNHGGIPHEYKDSTVEAVLADYIDEEMVEMGWSAEDVKVHACAKV